MKYDKIKIEVFRNIFQSICDEMGNVIRLSSFSPNIKERNDFSCALFLPNGESFAFGSHIPVHLGSMPLSVSSIINNYNFSNGDIFIMNDPYMGGTHLPDITLITPFYHKKTLQFFIACRAHHSDIGGMEPGSMPLAMEIYQEGLIIPPVKLYSKGKLSRDIIGLILSNTRTPYEREGDINAQIAGLNRGRQRLKSLIEYYGLEEMKKYANAVIDYSDTIFRLFLKDMKKGEFRFSDLMDDDGFNEKDIKLTVKITIDNDQIIFDFSESSPMVPGGINANNAITYSAILFSLISLFNEQIPINSGIMRSVKIINNKKNILNATKPSAMAGGNVETSQRIVDIILGALGMCKSLAIPAASQGTMNNITIGGLDYNNDHFTYYETIGGGCGAYEEYEGASGVHSHMTNSLNTPVEVIESSIPLIMKRYCLRNGSGGAGKYNGGDGIIREYEARKDLSISILSDRRKTAPYGKEGGGSGKSGRNILLRKNTPENLPSKINLKVKKGDTIIIKTPGGGGYGSK